MTTRADIVAELRTYIGTPFHHQAAVPGVGMDCIGVLRAIGKRFDIPGSRELESAVQLLAYGRDPDPVLLEQCDRFLTRIEWRDVGLADILKMKTLYSQGLPKHFAVISRTDPFYIIHAWAPGNERVIENRLDDRWRARVLACYRFRGLSDG